MPKESGLSNLSQARAIGATATVRNQVGRANRVDLFSFNWSDRTPLRLNFRSSGQRAMIALIRDRNENGQVEADEVVRSVRMQPNRAGVLDAANVEAGRYFVQVRSQGNGNTNYRFQVVRRNLIRSGPQPETPNPELAGLTNRVLELTNQFRQQNGLAPVRLNAQLNLAAQRYSEDMARRDFFEHRDPDNRSAGDRLSAAGYRWSRYAENLGAGYRSADAVVQGWIDSPGHRANLLNPDVREMGVGYFFLTEDPGNVRFNTYWTQKFATQLG